MVDVATFIERANKIADKFKRNSNLYIEAKQEAHALLGQFEEYLEAKGLKVFDSPET